MPLIRSKSALIIDSINAENPDLPTKLAPSNCYLYNFQYVDATKARCIVKGRWGSGIGGRTWVTYNKLDVDLLTKNCERDVVDNSGRSTLDYLHVINFRYGFDLLPGDIKDHSVVNKTCILELQPESTTFCGRVEFKVVAPQPDIGQVISTKEMTVNIDKYPAGGLMNGFVLTMSHDYSMIGETLYTQPSGVLVEADAIALAEELKRVDGVPWGIVADTLYSLIGAEITYNGTVTDCPASEFKTDVIRNRYEHVMLIKPVATTTSLTEQPLVIHYNLYQNERS